jgi:hypothetical protein
MDVDFLMRNTDLMTQVSSDIISYNSEYVVKTRSQTEKSTSSCRMWQLILAILDNLDEFCIQKYGRGVKEIITSGYGSNEYYDLLTNINFILENIKSNSLLNSLIYLNQYIDGSIINYDPETMPLQLGKNYMCIYIESVNNSILHYFNVIQTLEGEYYMNSSYGSEYVCVNQYTTPLSPHEFISFINALNNPDTDEEYIEHFFNTFFLAKNIGTFYTKDDYEGDRKKRFEMLVPLQGNKNETNVVTMNRYRNQIRCGIIPNYGELVKNVIYSREDTMDMGGGIRNKRKTIKRSRKTKYTTKNKKKRKTTKRGRSSRSSKRCSR